MIHLYAEHLLHIGSLSIHASLSTPSNDTTKATVSDDGRTITLLHAGESASIVLPASIPPAQASKLALPIPQTPNNHLSFRIQLGFTQPQTIGHTNGSSHEGNIIPWMSNTLTPSTQIRCQTCLSILVEGGEIKSWKDLPSEGWAEMMEFWHCHKPHNPNEDGAGAKKGYAAGSKLAVESGVGMVDPMDFLLVPGDCVGVEVEHQPGTTSADENQQLLHCVECHSLLGHYEPTTGAHRLSKMSLALSSYDSKASRSYQAQKWLACLLLCAVDSKGVRKFSVRASSNNFKLWVFTPDLTISSSTLPSGQPVRVVKVLWKDFDTSEDKESDRLTTASLAEDELHLTGDESRLLKRILQDSADTLPPASRTFQDWNVGLLERFTSSAIGTPR